MTPKQKENITEPVDSSSWFFWSLEMLHLLDFTRNLLWILILLELDGALSWPWWTWIPRGTWRVSMVSNLLLEPEFNSNLRVKKEIKFTFQHFNCLEGVVIVYFDFLNNLCNHILHYPIGFIHLEVLCFPGSCKFWILDPYFDFSDNINVGDGVSMMLDCFLYFCTCLLLLIQAQIIKPHPIHPRHPCHPGEIDRALGGGGLLVFPFLVSLH